MAIPAVLGTGAGVLLGFLGGMPSHDPLIFGGLVAATFIASAFATVELSLVVDFAALLLFGAPPATIVAAVGVVARGLNSHERSFTLQHMLSSVITAMLATQAAGLAYRVVGGTTGHFVWPIEGVAIAAAVVAYSAVKIAASDVVTPLLTGQSVPRNILKTFLPACSGYFIGAGVGTVVAELIDRRAWQLFPVVAVPLFFAYRVYSDYMQRLDADADQRKLIESLDDGVCIVDADGRVTLWNDALHRMLGCSRAQTLGRLLTESMPMMAHTELPRTIEEVARKRKPRTIDHLGLPSAAGGRTLQIKMLPSAGGVTLLWHDISDKTRAEHSLKRTEQRLALMVEGANDGLWEWDLRTQQFYSSGRWRSMMGLEATDGVGRPEEWIDRVHPEDVAGLKEALKAHLSGKSAHFEHEHRLRHEDGTYRWFLCRGKSTQGVGQRSARFAGSLTDTTDRATQQKQLQNIGFLDPLTGLRNRTDFVDVLGKRLEELKQRKTVDRFAVLYLDLDRFKIVNDSLGHLVGDELLVAVSRRLESCVPVGSAIARLGGDEFAILLDRVAEMQASVIAYEIQESLNKPLQLGGREVFTTVSIGIALGDAQYATPDEIMRDADTAMYHAKSRGKARHELFDADMHARARDRLNLENDLRHAVNTTSFEVHYQPIVSLASGNCIGFESLVRWTRDGKPISPATFIPIAEELGLIEPLGTWVLQQACRTFADWKRRFPKAALDCITVNASSRQLVQQNFMRVVQQAVQESGLNPSDLRIEITETALMDSPQTAAEVLRQLRDFGVKIYLDDFGTGYSSLSHLHKLPVDALKIDRSFVRSLAQADRPAIVESILALARTLNTSVVAEGIESDVQARELERLGCTHAQGFLFSKPLPSSAAEQLLAINQPLGPKGIQLVGQA